MNDEKRFQDIVNRMFSGEDELVKDDRTIERKIMKNKLAIQFLRKFDLDFLEFFLYPYFDEPNAIEPYMNKPIEIKPYMFMEAVSFQSTPVDDIYYEHIKRYRTYVK